MTTISNSYGNYDPFNFRIISPYIIDENKNCVLDKNGHPITDYRQIYGKCLKIGEDGHLYVVLSAGESCDDVSSYNWISGNNENNTIIGTSVNDTIYAGAGDDTVYGYNGNDIITGGRGNDNLQGDTGDDTYIFNLGDGQDTIFDYDSTPGNVDTIAFGEGIRAEDIILKRNGKNLEISVAGTTDKITVDHYYHGGHAYYQIEKVTFADGTIWDSDYLNSFVQTITGTDSVDILYGYTSYSNPNGIFNAGAGDDTVYGYNGNDIITGGRGNDNLQGNTGDDTYIFNLGDGQDSICDYDTTSGNTDTLTISDDYKDLIFSQSSSNLLIQRADSTDSITITSWFSGSAYQIENITAGSGYELSNTQVNLLIQSMASFEEDTGMSWTDAIEQNSSEYKNVLSQIWVKQSV